MCVPAEPVIGFEQRHVVGSRQEVCRGQTGDAGADDCDPLTAGTRAGMVTHA